MRRASLLVLVILGCSSETKEPTPAPATPAPAPAPAPAPNAAPAGEPAPPPVTKERCEQAADHLNRLVVATLVPQGASKEDRAYVEGLTKQRRETIVKFCLDTSPPAEVACMLAARSFTTLAACERHRRQVPPDLLERDYVTPEDCELFFLRLRQFKIADGVPAAEVDGTKDQLVRKCMDEARPGTLICFLAARSYEQARLCP